MIAFLGKNNLKRWLRNSSRTAARRRLRIGNARAGLALEPLEARTLLSNDLMSVNLLGAASADVAAFVAASNPAISATGRYVAFESFSDDLVPRDANGTRDVFVRNLETGTTTLISVNSAGTGSGACTGLCTAFMSHGSFDPAISDDGRFVAFVSFATDLVKDVVIDGTPNVYVRDRDADLDGVFDEPGPASVTRLLSVAAPDPLVLSGPTTTGDAPSGGGGTGSSVLERPVISGNGMFVAFGTSATNVAVEDPIPGDPPLMDFNGGFDIIKASVRGDDLSLVSINVSLTGTGCCGSGSSRGPSISRDGGAVAFESTQFDLVTKASGSVDDTNGTTDIFVGAGSAKVTLVSINLRGTDTGDGPSRHAAISRNGRHVAFASRASDLVAVDGNGAEDIFVRDLRSGKTTLVSRSRTDPLTGSGDAASPPAGIGFGTRFDDGPVISDSGRFIAFASRASDLLDPAGGVMDTNGLPDVYLFDRDADMDGIFDEAGATATMLVSVNSVGTASGLGAGSGSPTISADGRYVAFSSAATDLVAGGTDGSVNVYVRDMTTGVTTLVSASTSPAPGDLGGDDDSGLGPTPPQGASRVVISPSGTRVAYVSLASDLDPTTTDANGATDVHAFTPPPDILGVASKADRFIGGIVAHRVLFDSAPPFEIGFYRSADAFFDPLDELLATLPVTDPDDLSVGSHSTKYTIGTGAGDFAFPGIGTPPAAMESIDDYFILVVGDYLDIVAEFDADPFAEDNTGFFSVAYHEPGGPVFIHGGNPATTAILPSLAAKFGADTIRVTTTTTDLKVTYAGAITGTTTYALADVTGLRIRTHGGDDSVTGSPLADLIQGGDGKDVLDGGAGSDTIDGGPGPDSITGAEGDDLIFDGMGDDSIDGGPGDDTVMATPGSDDVFIDGGGSDALNFSLAARAITVNLWTEAIQKVDSEGNTLRLNGQWENLVGSPFDDSVSVRPLPVPRNLVGGGGLDDRLIFDALGLNVTFDGTKFMIPGFGDVTVSGFEDIQTINAAPRIIDDSDPAPAFSAPGFFPSDPNFPQGFNGGVRFSGANSGNTATWQFTNLAPGNYMVATTWTFAPDRATNSRFTIRDSEPVNVVVTVNQEQDPGEFVFQGIKFRNLAPIRVRGNMMRVELTDVGANQFVAADAVVLTPLNLGFVINDTPTSFNTVLCSPESGSGAFRDQHVCDAPGETAQWDTADASVFVTAGGRDTTFDVAATWTPSPGRSTDARYQIQTGSTQVEVSVNQQLAPSDFTEAGIPWRTLAQIRLDPNDPPPVIRLLDPQLGSVVADAIRLAAACNVSLLGRGTVVMAGNTFTLSNTTTDRRVTGKLTLQNTGSAHCNVGPVNVTGTGFSLGSDLATTSLPPGGSTDFEVAFQSTMLGPFAGTVSFPTNAFGLNPFNFNLAVDVVQDTDPPAVNIAEPRDGTTVFEGETLLIEVMATDDILVERVEFRVDGQVIATDMASPFETVIQVPMGVTQIMLEARAVDFGGNTGDSPPVVVIVEPDQPPTVQIITPGDGSGVVEGQTVPIEVNATDDVRVERVEFLVNGQVFQTETVEPFVAQFVVPMGVNPINLQARAMDTGGQVTSVSSNLTVFATPIMTKTSIIVGPNDFSTNDSEVPEFRGLPVLISDRVGLMDRFRFFPYGSGFTGGVRVATGDVNNDGVDDIITGTGPGASGGHVKVFSGVNAAELRSFFAFPGFTGGVTVASGDVNSDGFDDVIVGVGPGLPGGHVKVFSGQTNAEIRSFFAFPGFTGGVTVAAGDINSDGFDDIVVGAGPGAPDGHVKVFSGQTTAEIQSFFAFPMFTGGVTVASGDVNSDGFDDIIVGAGADPGTGQIKAFNGVTQAQLASFFANGSAFASGVRVATGDINNDGTPDIITGPGPGTGPQVQVFNGITLAELDNFFAYDAGFTSGVFVASPPTQPRARSNVVATIRHSSLSLIGDNLDNNVLIEQIGVNTYRVTGRSGTQINGQSGPVVFQEIRRRLDVHLNDGDDMLQIGSIGNPTSLPRSMLKLGRGDDTVVLSNVVRNKRIEIDPGAGPSTDTVRAVDVVLNDPCLSQIFSSRRKAFDRCLLIMVTPRIIIEED